VNILALNAGSSTLKYKLFQTPPGGFPPGEDPDTLLSGTEEHSGGDGLIHAAEQVIQRCGPLGVDAVGHRVVHGGAKFSHPTRITPEVLEGLRSLRDLDPLHNPSEVALMEAAQRLLPEIPAVAVFDTAFHRTLPEVAALYALPCEPSQRLGLRRYGFHGLSHQFVSERLLQCLRRDAAGTKLITCHLGSGASLCALRDGQSVDTSMGMTPLEGLVMGTRTGDIDPGLLLYLLQSHHFTPTALDDLLNRQSGLLGLSGRSNDVRELEQAAASGDPQAELALSVFAYRVRKYLGAYAAALGGLDAVVFTGGIGEHSSQMRERICHGLEFLGLRLETSLNTAAVGREAACISESGPVSVWVIPTNEEQQIAREVYAVVGKAVPMDECPENAASQ
jgi:acetate kinase